jgi:hypothetical protein
MTKIAGHLIILLLTGAFGLSIVAADDVDTFLKQIKDPSPDVRVKAIEELCAG